MPLKLEKAQRHVSTILLSGSRLLSDQPSATFFCAVIGATMAVKYLQWYFFDMTSTLVGTNLSYIAQVIPRL